MQGKKEGGSSHPIKFPAHLSSWITWKERRGSREIKGEGGRGREQ